jgi:hypothetical protein
MASLVAAEDEGAGRARGGGLSQTFARLAVRGGNLISDGLDFTRTVLHFGSAFQLPQPGPGTDDATGLDEGQGSGCGLSGRCDNARGCWTWMGSINWSEWSSAIVLVILYGIGLAQVDVFHGAYVLFCCCYFILPRRRRGMWRWLTAYTCAVTITMYVASGIFGYALPAAPGGSASRQTWAAMLGLHAVRSEFVLADTTFSLQLVTLALVGLQMCLYERRNALLLRLGNRGLRPRLEASEEVLDREEISGLPSGRMISWLWVHRGHATLPCFSLERLLPLTFSACGRWLR